VVLLAETVQRLHVLRLTETQFNHEGLAIGDTITANRLQSILHLAQEHQNDLGLTLHGIYLSVLVCLTRTITNNISVSPHKPITPVFISTVINFQT